VSSVFRSGPKIDALMLRFLAYDWHLDNLKVQKRRETFEKS
jgi:hypothetical protein